MLDPLTELLVAAEKGDLPAVQAALAAGADIHGRAPRTYETPGKGILVPLGGKPALYLAVEQKQGPIVEELLRRGADPDGLTEGTNFITGEGPLHLAARRGDLELTRLLLAGKATPHLKQMSRPNVPGKYALQLAAKAGHLEMVKLLLAVGGKPMQTAATAALGDAAEHGRVGVLELLLAHGATPNKTLPPLSWTPLMTACFGGFAPAARVLLDAGAEIRAVNRKGLTPLLMAVWGAKMAPENNRDVETPRDHVAVAALLLARGVKADEGSYEGKNALEFARDHEEFSALVRRVVTVLEDSLT